MKTLTLVLFASALVLGPVAHAAECMLSIDRTACEGKQEAAMKPYAGKNPTEEKTKAKDAEGCMKDAEKAAKIIRKGTLTKKVVTATFDGKEVGKKEDSAACK